MDQWAVVCCDAKSVLPHTYEDKDAEHKVRAHIHYSTPYIECFEPNRLAHCTYKYTLTLTR